MIVPDFRGGVVILLDFPFTDGMGVKKRPALVLLDTADNDLLLARITTQSSDSQFECELGEWGKAGLKPLLSCGCTSWPRWRKAWLNDKLDL